MNDVSSKTEIRYPIFFILKYSNKRIITIEILFLDTFIHKKKKIR